MIVKKEGRQFDSFAGLKPVINKFQHCLLILFLVSIIPFLLIIYLGLGFSNVQHHHLSFIGIQFEDTLKIKNTAGKTQSLSQNTTSDLFFIRQSDDALRLYYNVHDNVCTNLLFAHDKKSVQWINRAYSNPIQNRVNIDYEDLFNVDLMIHGDKITSVKINEHTFSVNEILQKINTNLVNIIDKIAKAHPEFFDQNFINNLFSVFNGSKIIKSNDIAGNQFDFFPGAIIQKSNKIRIKIDNVQLTPQARFYANNLYIPKDTKIESGYNISQEHETYSFENKSRYALYKFETPIRISLFNDFQNTDTCKALITTNENILFTNTKTNVYYAPHELEKENIYNIEYGFSYIKGRGNSQLNFSLHNNFSTDSTKHENEEKKFSLSIKGNAKAKWEMEIVNTSPRLMWFWFFIPLFVIYLIIHFTHNYFYYQGNRSELKWYQKLPTYFPQRKFQYSDYNPVTSTFLMGLIPLLAFRFFLMWRANIFPPLSGQNLDYFTHYFGFPYSGNHIIWVNIILIFVIVLGGITLWEFLFLRAPGILLSRLNNWIKNSRSWLFVIFYYLIGLTFLLIGIYYLSTLNRNALTRLTTTSFFIFFLFCFFEMKKNNKSSYGFIAGSKTKLWPKILMWSLFGLVLTVQFLLEKSFFAVTLISVVVWLILTGGKMSTGKTKFLESFLFRWLIGVLIIAAIVFLPFLTKSNAGFKFLDSLDNRKQTVARLALMASERDSLLLNNEAVLKNEDLFRKVVITNQMQAYINWYQKKGGFFTFFPEFKEHYEISNRFRDQATDLTALRYIAAEHGWLILIPLLLLLLTPLYARLIIDKYPRSYSTGKHNRITNADLLYLIIYSFLAVFVMLSSSNMFIFMGLDLPIIGFHSVQAILLPVIFIFIIALSYDKNYEYFKVSGTEERKSFESSYTNRKKKYIWIFIFSLLGFIICMNIFVYKNKLAKNKYSLEEFNITMSNETEHLNEKLAQFQQRCLERNPSLSETALVQMVRDSIDDIQSKQNRIQSFLCKKIKQSLGTGASWSNNKNEFIQPEKISITGKYEVFKFNYLNPYSKNFPLGNEFRKNPVIYTISPKTGIMVLCRTVVENGSSRIIYPKRDSFPLIYHLTKYILNSDIKMDSVRLAINLDINDSLTAVIQTDSIFSGNKIDNFKKYHNFTLLSSAELKNIYNGSGLWWDDFTGRLRDSNNNRDSLLSPEQTQILDSIFHLESISKLAAKLKEFIEDEIEKKCKRINITAVDQNGSIKVLYSYNADYAFDPNKMEKLNSELEEYSVVATNEGALNNSILKHPCMQKMFPGPGSSFKPIIYSAITSQSNFPWQDLKINNSFQHFIQNASNGPVQGRYAEEDIFKHNIIWHTPGLEGVFGEMDPIKFPVINPSSYLAKSSNLYHSVVLFLGYYPTEILNHYNNLLLPNASLNANFPVLQAPGSNYFFNSENWPVGNFNSSAIYQGLKSNFGFKFSASPDTSDGIMYDLGINSYVFGERPSFDTTLFSDNNKFSWFKKYIVTATSGGDPISISNLQMSYLTTIFFSQNRGLRLKWVSDDSAATVSLPFVIQNPKYSTVFRNEINALGKDIFNYGTLLSVRKLFYPDNHNMNNPMRIGPLYLFAKTGTSNIGGSGKPSDKLLLGCLSNQDINRFNNQEQFSYNKFLGFFIQQKEGGNKDPERLRYFIIKQLAKIL